MIRLVLNIFILIILLSNIIYGTFGTIQSALNVNISFQKPCEMDHCNSNLPKCPLCPYSGPTNLYIQDETKSYTPVFTSFFILSYEQSLSDQEVVKSIFRPPTSIL